MKTMKIVKLNINTIGKTVPIYYGAILGLFIFAIIINKIASVDGSINGIEFITTGFLFGSGIGAFKVNYYFAKANNISKKSFMKGMIISIIPVAFCLSIIDIIINKIAAMFINSSTLYDISYGQAVSQSDTVVRFLESLSFQFILSIVAYLIGLISAIAFYKANKAVKILIGMTPIALIMAFNYIVFAGPEPLQRVLDKIIFLLGLNPFSLWRTIISFIIISICLSIIGFALMRKINIKK